MENTAEEKNTTHINAKDAHVDVPSPPQPKPSTPPVPDKYDPKDFSVKHQKMVALVANGYSVTQAAKLFGCSRGQASRIVNSVKGQSYFQKLKELDHASWKDRSTLREAMADRALRIRNEIMSDEEQDPRLRAKIAGEILAELGEGAITKHEHKQETSYKDSVDLLLTRMKETKKELGITPPVTLDADFTIKEQS